MTEVLSMASETYRRWKQMTGTHALATYCVAQGATKVKKFDWTLASNVITYTFSDGSVLKTTGQGPNHRVWINGWEIVK